VLNELPTGADVLPPAVYELGTRVLTPPAAGNGLPASIRTRTRNGRWATLEGAPLEGADRSHAAISIRAATAGEAAQPARAHLPPRRTPHAGRPTRARRRLTRKKRHSDGRLVA